MNYGPTVDLCVIAPNPRRHILSHKRTQPGHPNLFGAYGVIVLQLSRNGRRHAIFISGKAYMDIARKNVGRRKLIRWIVTGVLTLGAVTGISFGVRRLKPAAPGVDMSTLWPDTVRRGPMVREVNGLGTLVPEDTMLITAMTDARIERILIRPGTPVRADSVVMIMTSPELDTLLLSAQYTLKASQADYDNLKVTLQKGLLDMQSKAAEVGADYQMPSCRRIATPSWPRMGWSPISTPKSPPPRRSNCSNSPRSKRSASKSTRKPIRLSLPQPR